MKWTDFMKKYCDEESCKREWKKYRDQVGVICPHCGCKDHYWKADKECYECKKCKYRQSLRFEHCNARFPIAFPLLVHCNPDAHIYKEEHLCQGTSASAWSQEL